VISGHSSLTASEARPLYRAIWARRMTEVPNASMAAKSASSGPAIPSTRGGMASVRERAPVGGVTAAGLDHRDVGAVIAQHVRKLLLGQRAHAPVPAQDRAVVRPSNAPIWLICR
jgi:hypothetical protein